MAIKYYAGNRLTGVSGDSKPTTLPTGSTFLETNTDDLYLWDGDSWNAIASNTGTETLSNKTMGTELLITELGSSAGTPSSGFGTVYAKNNKLYFKADDGTESDLTAGVGSTGSIAGASDTTFTSVNDGALILYDTTTSMWRDADMSGVATINDTGVLALSAAAISGQTAEASVSNTNDFVLVYDGSASALRKMTVGNLISAGVSVDNLSALTDTTITSVASAQIIIYDGTDSWDNKTISGDATINTSGVLTLAASQTGITSVGALNAGSITSGFGTINTGSSNITTTGTVSAGNLTVTGTTTTVNSTVLTVVDPIIHLQTASGGGNLSADTNKDVGLMMEYHNGSAAKEAFLGWDDSASKLTFIPDASLSSEVVSGSVGTIVANLEGDVTGAVTGNADTATALATGRTVGMTGDITWTSASFTGSGNVTGTAAITADVIVNADINTGAGIVDTKLATISTADKVAGGAIQIDSGTDGTGITIGDADKLLIDDGGATKYINAAQLKTYAAGASADESFAIAMAVAL
jgi:hypothetical protein